jgi:hypothetical protein
MKYANSDEFVERMKCFRKKTSGETEYLTPVKYRAKAMTTHKKGD